ncbi:glycosyltransferase family 4 protein [Bacillus infantis]|uniref:glycosyltransferase family 4 protein n=1 Tax=Bacillus infantis TaxID=324767 RepID=UPI001CD692D9|nr:glycosyltransferase family 4 protein [Bacillus infantis]MCA1041617.1 glycosyltransferase family 4 protein [Bacillus infantis]
MNDFDSSISNKKVLIVCTTDSMIFNFLIPHIEKLHDEGCIVECACSKTGFYLEELQQRFNLKVHEMPFSRSPLRINNFVSYFKLKKLVESGKYDIIQCHEPVGGVMGRVVGKLHNITVHYTAHGFHFFKGAPLKNWLLYFPVERWLSKYTDLLITINKEDYDTAIKKNFKAKRIELINGVGIDLEKFTPQTFDAKKQLRYEYGYKENDFILIYAGELSFRKHQDLLINVVGVLKNKIPNIKLLLAGDGEMLNRYKKQVDSLGIKQNVEFLGYRKDISKLMLMSDIALSSSRQEGLPVNVMEAMATGLPLVVTECRGNSDLVSNNVNGNVIKMDDLDSFCAAIEELYSSEELRVKFGSKNLEYIKQFSLKNVLKEMQKLYKTNG